jgi:hypothetical protein
LLFENTKPTLSDERRSQNRPVTEQAPVQRAKPEFKERLVPFRKRMHSADSRKHMNLLKLWQQSSAFAFGEVRACISPDPVMLGDLLTTWSSTA